MIKKGSYSKTFDPEVFSDNPFSEKTSTPRSQVIGVIAFISSPRKCLLRLDDLQFTLKLNLLNLVLWIFQVRIREISVVTKQDPNPIGNAIDLRQLLYQNGSLR